MASTIQIKRTTTNGQPDSLQYGELAYSATSYSSNTGGDKLYIGTTPYANGLAQVVQPIGGKFYVDKLDHTPGTLTPNSAIIVDDNSKIDNLLVDFIQLNGNTITLADGGVLNLGDANTTVNIAGGIDLSIDANRIAYSNGSAIVSSALLTFNDTEFKVGNSSVFLSFDTTTDGSANVQANTIQLANLQFSSQTITVLDNATDLTVDGTSMTGSFKFLSNTALQLPVGTTDERPGSSTVGMVRFNANTSSYEGYDGSNWASLGGTKDVDQDTFIQAETSPGSDEDTLYFHVGDATNPILTINSTAAVYTSNATFNPYLQIGDIQIQNNVISGGSNHSNEIIINPDPASNAGTLTIQGDLQVFGNTTTIASTVTTVEDPIFTLGGDSAPTSNDSKDRGIEFNYYSGSAKVGFFGYDESTDEFVFIEDATNSSEVFSGSAGAARFGNLSLEGQIAEYNGNTTINNGEILVGGTGGFLKTSLTDGQSITITTGDGSLQIDADLAQSTETANTSSANLQLTPAANNYNYTGVASFASEQFSVSAEGHVYLLTLDGGTY